MPAVRLREGFEVEWCSKLPVDEHGDADHDSATIEVHYISTIEAARRKAVEVFPLDQYKQVLITPFRIDSDQCIEYTGDSEVYDGSMEGSP